MVPRLHVRHAFTYALHNASTFVPKDGREQPLWIAPFERVRVSVAERNVRHFDADLASLRGCNHDLRFNRTEEGKWTCTYKVPKNSFVKTPCATDCGVAVMFSSGVALPTPMHTHTHTHTRTHTRRVPTWTRSRGCFASKATAARHCIGLPVCWHRFRTPFSNDALAMDTSRRAAVWRSVEANRSILAGSMLWL